MPSVDQAARRPGFLVARTPSRFCAGTRTILLRVGYICLGVQTFTRADLRQPHELGSGLPEPYPDLDRSGSQSDPVIPRHPAEPARR